MELRSSICLTGPYSISDAATYMASCGFLNMFVLCSSSTRRNMVLKGQFYSSNDTKVYHRKLLKNLRYPRKTKLLPDPCLNGLSMVYNPFANDIIRDDGSSDGLAVDDDNVNEQNELFEEEGSYDVNNREDGEIVWEQDEIETISSLFKEDSLEAWKFGEEEAFAAATSP